MDFDPGPGIDDTFGITVEAHETLILDLQWAEPWNGVVTNLDAYLLSSNGAKVVAKSTEANISGTQRPVEIVGWENNSASSQTVQLAIDRRFGLSPRLKFILLQNGGGVSAVEYPKSSGEDVVGPAVLGHAGAASAIAVAAVPYNDSSRIERYSSRGPVTHLFGPVEGPTPALPLGVPEVIPKPDLAATDCGVTTFFAFPQAGTWRFCGTSAAAPHAAAVAALVRQAKPTLPNQKVRDTLEDTAASVGGFPADAAGAGRVDAFAAIASLPGPIEGGDGPSEPTPPLENPSVAGTDPGPAGAPGAPGSARRPIAHAEPVDAQHDPPQTPQGPGPGPRPQHPPRLPLRLRPGERHLPLQGRSSPLPLLPQPLRPPLRPRPPRAEGQSAGPDGSDRSDARRLPLSGQVPCLTLKPSCGAPAVASSSGRPTAAPAGRGRCRSPAGR